jgi:hypothetical protein
MRAANSPNFHRIASQPPREITGAGKFEWHRLKGTGLSVKGTGFSPHITQAKEFRASV